MSRILVFIIAIFFLQFTYAAHVTDKLVIGLYTQPSKKGDLVELLTSGTPIEIIETKGQYTKVRLTNNKKGWIETTYVTEEKPASVMLLEAQAEIRELKQKNNSNIPSNYKLIEQQLDIAKNRIKDLEKSSEDMKKNTAQIQVNDLRQRIQKASEILNNNEVYKDTTMTKNANDTSFPTLIFIIFILIFGIAIGFIISNFRSKKKFGGIEI